MSTPSSQPLVLQAVPEPIIHINIPVSLKLDRYNFLTWRSQVEPIVTGFGLFHHLDETTAAPTQFLVIDGVSSSNPVYLSWLKQDQLLLGWLRSSIFGLILGQYVSCRTARELWSSLHRVYSAVSRTRIMELRRLLQTTSRGGQPCNEYFERMRNIADQLTAIGQPVPDSDLVSHILTGLGPEYNSFVVALTTRADPVSSDDLLGFLLSHEQLIGSQLGGHQDPLALYSQRQKGSHSLFGPNQPNNNHRGRGRNNRGRGYSHRGRSNSNSAQGASSSRATPGSHSNNSSDRPQCQICRKRGHEARECWYRYDDVYPADPSTNAQALITAPTSTPSEGWFFDSGVLIT